jgi:DNA uptake protein ComE-like DNA-binding protein
MSTRRRTCLAVTAALALSAAGARAQVASGLTDPNVAPREVLATLPHLSESVAEALVEARPFAGALALDGFLEAQGLTPEQRAELYASAFIHIDLDRASSEEMQLIPGVGERMAHEFDEYRPWKSWAQFDREIGKYVDEAEVARLKRYCFIPMDLNTASEADFMTIPGVGRRMAHEFEEYRPWKAKAQFEREIGKYVDAKEVARLWRYFVIGEE